MTSDSSIDTGKKYYTRSAVEPYSYTLVSEPKVADIGTYYENTTSNSYAARKFRVACEVSDISGEDDQVVKGNLNAIGDPAFGLFDPTTKVFTETSKK